MNSSERKRADSVIRNGVVFMTLTGPSLPGVEAFGYVTTESRGYKTGFQPKIFFYLLTKDNRGVFAIKGITKDARRKGFTEHCRVNGINCEVVNRKWFDAWLQ